MVDTISCLAFFLRVRADRRVAPAIAARLKEMRKQKNLSGYAEAADNALKAVTPATHPSRALLERLILDEAAWPFLYDEWHKLVSKKVTRKELVGMLARDGEEKFDENLRTLYGLTPDAARAVARTLTGTLLTVLNERH